MSEKIINIEVSPGQKILINVRSPENLEHSEHDTFSITDAAKSLGISRSTINRAINNGKIQIIKEPNKAPRISREELIKFKNK